MNSLSLQPGPHCATPLTRAAYDSADWMEPDPDVVERIACLLGLVEKSSAAAVAAFHRLHDAVADAVPAPAGEAWGYSDGTAPGRDAELLKRDADIVRRFRERLAEAFDCPTSYPFFRRDWLPGEDADEALLRIFRSNKAILDRSEDDMISAIMEHQRRHGRGCE
ncbi:MAG TPA: hypothetical protein VHT91_20715 [Kofleriaceae bacterium]|jgi:hypothetical protein|nr:hypothetical protein [Kofleriaceae bacterium]